MILQLFHGVRVRNEAGQRRHLSAAPQTIFCMNVTKIRSLRGDMGGGIFVFCVT